MIGGVEALENLAGPREILGLGDFYRVHRLSSLLEQLSSSDGWEGSWVTGMWLGAF